MNEENSPSRREVLKAASAISALGISAGPASAASPSEKDSPARPADHVQSFDLSIVNNGTKRETIDVIINGYIEQFELQGLNENDDVTHQDAKSTVENIPVRGNGQTAATVRVGERSQEIDIMLTESGIHETMGVAVRIHPDNTFSAGNRIV